MERWKERKGRRKEGPYNKHNILSQRNFIMLSVPSMHTTEKKKQHNIILSC